MARKSAQRGYFSRALGLVMTDSAMEAAGADASENRYQLRVWDVLSCAFDGQRSSLGANSDKSSV
jgi:hypothetical protein